MERGTVRMRVAFVLRSAEVQPLFWDLCDGACILTDARRPLPILPPQHTTHNPKYSLTHSGAKSRNRVMISM